METGDLLRHQIIESLMATRHAEKVADAAVILWEQIASQIISVVGEGGFTSLYARSLFLTQPSVPWLAAGALSPQADHRFAGLKTCLEAQRPEQASAANRLLLITFTDILASLVGEELTITLIRSAWGNDASDKAGKEFENE
jgi:hypothetical protein